MLPLKFTKPSLISVFVMLNLVGMKLHDVVVNFLCQTFPFLSNFLIGRDPVKKIILVDTGQHCASASSDIFYVLKKNSVGDSTDPCGSLR